MICSLCGAEMKIRTARHGRYKGQNFWGCTNWPDCDFKIDCPDSMQPKTVKVGSKVRIHFIDNDSIEEFTIFELSREEVARSGSQYNQYQKPDYVVTNPGDHENRSDESPLVRAILGKREGENATVKAPVETYDVKILKIS